MADRRDTPPRGYTTDEVEAERSARPRRRHTGKKILAGIILVPVLLAVLWTTITMSWAYSSGERGGYVQKFSHKGWLCKTWEGELAMVNMPGAMQQTFEFSVRDDAVARQIEQAVASGQRVALHYEQHRGVPTSCFGETQYFVDQVRIAPTMPGVPTLPGTTPAPTPAPPATTPPATPPATTPPPR